MTGASSQAAPIPDADTSAGMGNAAATFRAGKLHGNRIGFHFALPSIDVKCYSFMGAYAWNALYV